MDAIAFFEREYFTLAQLLHPRIVSVHDYGIDATGPYYTMELLDGGDLQRKAPVDWRQACAFARDLCSALALVHSRRLVYRDLSPRNVRCTSDGLAKLIDFGAMGPMGPAKELIGTLPCCAPETVDLQPLDARTDLYALGATLYYTLTGRHAYPAREFAQLVELWRGRPRRPSEIVAGIPEALDRLVLDLMNLDPAVRPASAAEVMERLSAIAGLPSDEQLPVAQAYLATPTLVGRESDLDLMRKMVARAQRRRGASVLIRGPAGVGRSRLLDALVLEGKLGGAVVLRADAGDATSGHYGVVRAIAAQLLRAFPTLALEAVEAHLPVLGHVIPELLAGRSDVKLQDFEDSQQLRRRVQPALRQWLSDLGRRKSIIIAVDDLHRIDEPSAVFLALLSNEVSQRSIVLAVTVDSRAQVPPYMVSTLKLFSDSSSLFALDALTAPHTEQLLGSIFGEQPNLARLSHRLFGIAGGNPRDVLRLAQHLIDKRVLRYQAGAWVLPEAIETIELPSSMAEALRERVAALDPDARNLALALALGGGERMTFDECLLLTTHQNRARLSRCLEQLVAREVVVLAGPSYQLGRQGWSAALREGVRDGGADGAHLGLARIFERRGDGFRMARHLVQGGEPRRGFDVFVEHCRVSEEQTNASSEAFQRLLQSMPLDWFAQFEAALALAGQLQRPALDTYLIRSRLSGLAAMVGSRATPHLEALVEQLHRECGLQIYESLDPSLGVGERLGQAMGAAWQRYNEKTESERSVDPGTALVALARAVVQSIGLLAITCDYERWKHLPSLRPFAAISPAIAVVDQLAQGVGARIGGRIEQCLGIYRPLIERLAEPDRAGLDETHHRHTRLRVIVGICTLEATMGVKPDPARIEELEAHALYEPSAGLIRMVASVWQGDMPEADRWKRHVELLQIQTTPRQINDGTHLISEIVAYAFMEDLTRVKRTIEAVEGMANEYPGWTPVLLYATAEYHRIRGDHESALADVDKTLALFEAGCHRIWPHAAGMRIGALAELGRLDEARAAGEEYLCVADRCELGYAKSYVEMPYALVLAKLGEMEAATEVADHVIHGFEVRGIGGLNLSIAHEARARVALAAHDQPAFEKHAALSSKQRRGGHGLKGARYAQLAQQVGTVDVIGVLTEQDTVLSQFTSVLASCKSSGERAQRGLEMLVRLSGSVGGALYGMKDTERLCWAHTGKLTPNAKIDALAHDYLKSEMNDENETRIVDDVQSVVTSFTREWHGPGTDRYVPVLLSHQVDSGLAITGVAVLMVDATCRFTYPAALATELSRLCHEAGDVSIAII
jgi:hypothetical protein